eukprot:CAMPEP_0201689296 /NCGR_PEP_ID=MMETSP0578-20130828/2911_1 /ASSEMBLY_ACC=CAM_ASM_000663 /TAXON_ID=267565 /ORGANISM="Skeletonema grethea, Strain CCMP 1804" /LENGTH=331 /DNA_ID=CAMNT_0048173895 /DNA_START=53 /DNA_END=1048 /DNA_ORIENTATION=+
MSSAAAKDETTDRNKKLKAYSFIAITSLINVASIAEAKDVIAEAKDEDQSTQNFNLLWGLLTLFLSMLIIFIDVVDIIKNKFDFKTIMDGKVEGYTLLGFVTCWAIGVIFLTRAGGLGYSSLNVYFSTWATFFGCIHALDLWLGEKDLVTMQKLCSLSSTLPYWWILWFASIVTFGSAADARRLIVGDNVVAARESCDVAIGIGLASFLFSFFFILSHYEFLQCSVCMTWMTYGGMFELAVIVVVDIWQVVAVHTLTSAGKIGSTIAGQGDEAAGDYVPGSNIYFAVWCSVIASMSITVKWKEARAMKFAQTQNEVNEEEGLDVTDDDEEI